MTSSKQGVSLREIARTWEVNPSYISKLFLQIGIKPLADGSYDIAAATAARERCTIPGKGQKRWARRHADPDKGTGACEGCGDRYITKYARNHGVPHYMRFCSCSCEQDAADGLTVAQIATRREKSICPKNWKSVQHNPPWQPPPRPTPIIRICVACGGRYDQNQDDASEHYCYETCKVEFEAGISREEIRRNLMTTGLEGDYTRKEVTAPGFFDYVDSTHRPNRCPRSRRPGTCPRPPHPSCKDR